MTPTSQKLFALPAAGPDGMTAATVLMPSIYKAKKKKKKWILLIRTLQLGTIAALLVSLRL